MEGGLWFEDVTRETYTGRVLAESPELLAYGHPARPAHVLGHAPASSGEHVGATPPSIGTLQHICQGGQHASPQHT
jgi:hypothetical protein